MSLPPSTLIISTRNRSAMLMDTIESVLAGVETPSELIIVDHSDVPDDTFTHYQPPRRCRINYIWRRESGLSRARNTGIVAAAHDIVAIVDDDMFVEPGWYASLISELVQAGHHAAVTGQVLAASPQSSTGFAPSLVTSEVKAVYRGRIDRDVLAGGNMAFFRATFDCVGYFDERLGAGSRLSAADDNDFGYRLLEAGYRIIYVPEATVYHRAWREASDFIPLRRGYGRGKGGYYFKHLNWRDGHMFRRMMRDVGRRLLFMAPRMFYNRRRALGDAAYIGGICRGAWLWCWSDRKRQPTGPGIPIPALHGRVAGVSASAD